MSGFPVVVAVGISSVVEAMQQSGVADLLGMLE
jgi:hypothetical protein